MAQAKENQSGQRECRRHLNVLRYQQSLATVKPVCKYSADEREEHDRQLLQEGIKPKVKRRAAQREDKPVLGHVLHPRANAGGARTDPENPEIAVMERRECPAQSVSTGQGC